MHGLVWSTATIRWRVVVAIRVPLSHCEIVWQVQSIVHTCMALCTGFFVIKCNIFSSLLFGFWSVTFLITSVARVSHNIQPIPVCHISNEREQIPDQIYNWLYEQTVYLESYDRISYFRHAIRSCISRYDRSALDSEKYFRVLLARDKNKS